MNGGKLADTVAAGSSRRGFLARVGAAVMGITGAKTVGSLVAPGEAEAYHFCGHIYTTDSCPHPTGLPRIDSKGFPIRAKNARPVDDLGRYIDAQGFPVDDDGAPLTDADGARLPRATRTPVCDARRPTSTASSPMWTAPGTAAAAAGSASSSTVAGPCATASTATRRSRATATRAARSSASCTTTRR